MCLKRSWSHILTGRERYLVFSSVLRLNCILQVVFGRSRWNCYIMDAIWTLGFARNIVFFQGNESSVGEKSRLTRATVSGIVALPWNLARNACAVELRVPGDFFSCRCCAIVLSHVLRHLVHCNWCITAICSTAVSCYSIALGNSLCRSQWNGCVKVPCCCGRVRNTNVFRSWKSQIIL